MCAKYDLPAMYHRLFMQVFLDVSILKVEILQWQWKRKSIVPKFIISAKWTEWTLARIYCDALFLPSVRPSVCTQYLDANISKTVWDRDLVPINH